MNRRSLVPLALALLVVLAAAPARPRAQPPAKKPLTVEDYTRWRSITDQEISGDGKWVTYVLQLTNVPAPETKPVLHLLNPETNQDLAVPDATGGTFSPDSRWLAYQVDPGRARRGRGGRGSAAPGPESPGAQGPQGAGRGGAEPIPPRRAELRNLATGAVQAWQEIDAFLFSPDASYLILKRQRPEGAGGGSGRSGSAAVEHREEPAADPVLVPAAVLHEIADCVSSLCQITGGRAVSGRDAGV